MTNSPRPPAHLEPYVRVLGVDLAIEFLLAFGGAELYLSANPTARSRLVQLVGMDRARALAEALDCLPRRIPTGKPWIASVWRTQGTSVSEIARKLHVTDVTVRRFLKQNDQQIQRDDHRQLRLL
ncbi:helix-turn-helix domain-containing protein [Pseudorhodobacter sp. E13]|uniref:helix-turn-helix domain-containing protein n=1 Tax=Pseudorhodobacter sp. E13 TaxID=2487931 RepID=UPI000F8D9D2B|nr:helix-turn-helix domain-containing protein [Pseudorhodobacter sp. E13]RUS64893.1 helix-turn-helix domain-containing protein [Pseudorhodobacter sp. E13]